MRPITPEGPFHMSLFPLAHLPRRMDTGMHPTINPNPWIDGYMYKPVCTKDP